MKTFLSSSSLAEKWIVIAWQSQKHTCVPVTKFVCFVGPYSGYQLQTDGGGLWEMNVLNDLSEQRNGETNLGTTEKE